MTLSQLLNTTDFSDLKASDSRVVALRSLAQNVLTIEVAGRIRDSSTKVYQIQSINFYANLATQPMRVEYDGKHLLVKNFTSDCVEAIDSDSSHFVEAVCTTPG